MGASLLFPDRQTCLEANMGESYSLDLPEVIWEQLMMKEFGEDPPAWERYAPPDYHPEDGSFVVYTLLEWSYQCLGLVKLLGGAMNKIVPPPGGDRFEFVAIHQNLSRAFEDFRELLKWAHHAVLLDPFIKAEINQVIEDGRLCFSEDERKLLEEMLEAEAATDDHDQTEAGKEE